MVFPCFTGSQPLHHTVTGTLAEQIVTLEDSSSMTQIA